MLFAVLLLLVGIPIIGAVLFMSLRHWGIEDARTEARRHAPGAHTVTCVIPDGQDPAVLRAALTRAGFVCVHEPRPPERLLVECEPEDRARIREIADQTHPAGLAGAQIQDSREVENGAP